MNKDVFPFTPIRNPLLRGFICLRCEAKTEISLRHDGCLPCRNEGHYVSLAADYVFNPQNYRYLPYLEPFALGEANTPLIDIPSLAKSLGVTKLTLKDESQNPTGSHKDRMSAYGIAQALEGRAHTVVLASSGNAAVSAALYAKAAGLACEVAVYTSLHRVFEETLATYGAKIHRFSTNEQRWGFVAERANTPGYFALTNHHLPALGSAPLGIEAYKAIAYECFEQGQIPTQIFVPTARGDLAWGILSGFIDLLHAKRIKSVPKIWIVEPFPRLLNVITGAPLHGVHGGSTEQFSTAGTTVTYLQMLVAQQSNSSAIVVDDAAAKRARSAFLQIGVAPELCAAATLDAVLQLKQSGNLHATDHIMLLLTANASRDPSCGAT
jgi:threonine synthase